MRKIFFTVMVLFVTSTKAQDTIYYHQRNHFYRVIRTQMNDSSMVGLFPQLTKKQKRSNNIFAVTAGVIFTGLAIWYFNK
jgi:hypothetical protein